MALANTTKLEAVNTMLHTISEAPINSLSGSFGIQTILCNFIDNV